MTCPSCEYNKERAARWRREAYRLGGTPLPEPEGGTMNKEDIIRMARESCDTDKVDAWHNGFWTLTQEELERFAALVAAAEREACAIAGAAAAMAGLDHAQVAAAIRARGNHE